jgi:RNA polymerase sigma factor (sigma-70 family)
MARMPTIEEVIAYAQPMARQFIGKIAADLPPEQHEEIIQELYVRLLTGYESIDPEAGWKSWVYNHARGAVMDYIKFGRGFQESKWNMKSAKSGKAPKLAKRIGMVEKDGQEDLDIDQILGSHGIFHATNSDDVIIKWNLLAKMSSQDENLHAFAKYLRGISVEDMAPVFGLCRTRVSQMIQVFLDRFDDPEWTHGANDIWLKQICYALGICELLGLPDEDQSVVQGFIVGWMRDPVDLDSLTPHHYLLEQASQMEMKLDEEEESQIREK